MSDEVEDSSPWRPCCHTRQGTDHLAGCRLAPRPVEPTGRSDGPTAYAPHCDSSILHAPGECRFCDEFPAWQAYRAVARVNFTGHAEEGLAPCPSEHFRSPATRDRWHGNVAVGHNKVILDEFLTLGEAVPGSYRLSREMYADAFGDWKPGGPFDALTDQSTYAEAASTHDLKPPEYSRFVRAWGWVRWKLHLHL